MDKDRSSWLKELKVGDTVVNKRKNRTFGKAGPSGVIASYVYDRFIIKNITPTGKIRLDNGILLNNNGENKSEGYYIEEYSEELIREEKEVSERIKLYDDIISISKRISFNYLKSYKTKELEDIKKVFEDIVDKKFKS